MNSELRALIATRTGRIDQVQPVSDGNSPATTAIITAEHEKVFIKAVPDRPGGRREEVIRQGQIAPALGGLSPALLWQTRGNGWCALGFEVLESRPSDFAPGSADLPLVIEVVDRVNQITVPEVAGDWWETRWDEYLTDSERELIRGDHVVHADLHPHNLVVDPDGRMWVLDWAWPTRASAVVTLSCLAVQLVSAGHTPTEVDKLLAASQSWRTVNQEAAAVFARADARLQASFADRWPEAEWVGAMATAAQAWADHRAGRGAALLE